MATKERPFYRPWAPNPYSWWSYSTNIERILQSTLELDNLCLKPGPHLQAEQAEQFTEIRDVIEQSACQVVDRGP
jgi:hypothetical protein